MRVLKNIFSQLHSFVLWALFSALLWGWVFSFVTDTSIEKKVTVYCYVPEIRDTELSAKLEEDMPEGLKMIRVRSFEYVMMDMEAIVFVRGKEPNSEMIKVAEARGIVLMSTELPMFVACGKLYAAGLDGGKVADANE